MAGGSLGKFGVPFSGRFVKNRENDPFISEASSLRRPHYR